MWNFDYPCSVCGTIYWRQSRAAECCADKKPDPPPPHLAQIHIEQIPVAFMVDRRKAKK